MATAVPATTVTPTTYSDIELLFDLDTVLTGADDFIFSDQTTTSVTLAVSGFPTVATCDACAVCIEDFRPDETGKRTPCGHVFHETCIASWLGVGDSCPLCRRHISGGRSEEPQEILTVGVLN